MDIAFYKDFKLLVAVDAHSKWIDIQMMDDISTTSTITAARRMFKYVGLPVCVVTDNGTNFASDQFGKFLVNNYIRHVKTPPGHHQSNGLVERRIQELKFALNRTLTGTRAECEEAVIAFCLHSNTTPACNGAVPAAAVFSNIPRTRLSSICTERRTPAIPTPIFIQVEGRGVREGQLAGPVGSNTALDERNRLVHDSQVTRRSVETGNRTEDSNGGNVPADRGSHTAVGVSVENERPRRIRSVPARYGIEDF